MTASKIVPGSPVSTQTVILELISYDREQYSKHDSLNVDELCNNLQPNQVNWVNLDGLSDLDIIEKLQAKFSLHPLLIDDIMADQRPKAEEYEGYLFFTLKMLYKIDSRDIDYEQINFVLFYYYCWLAI